MLNKPLAIVLTAILAGRNCAAQRATRTGLPMITPEPDILVQPDILIDPGFSVEPDILIGTGFHPDPDILVDPGFQVDPDILVDPLPPWLTPTPIVDPVWYPPWLECPSIVSTTSVCRRCRQPECITVSTVTLPTYCVNPPYTKHVAHKCHKPCPTGCATTEYVYVTPTPLPELPPITPTLPTPDQEGTPCAVTVTSTVNPGVAGGCEWDCYQGCIADNLLILPCGCTQATALITETVSSCSSYYPCYDCQTGWGIYTITETCPPGALET